MQILLYIYFEAHKNVNRFRSLFMYFKINIYQSIFEMKIIQATLIKLFVIVNIQELRQNYSTEHDKTPLLRMSFISCM